MLVCQPHISLARDSLPPCYRFNHPLLVSFDVHRLISSAKGTGAQLFLSPIHIPNILLA